MATNPPAGYSRITPYLLYEDAAAALDWLARAFGFRERFRHEADGLIDHAEMEYGGSEIMLASPGNDYRSPVDSAARRSSSTCMSTISRRTVNARETPERPFAASRRKNRMEQFSTRP
jgi:uncharacterized glyoxalase superfamily protein PhnB